MKSKLRVGTMPVMAVQFVILPLVIWLLCMSGVTKLTTQLYAEIFLRDIEQQSQRLTMNLDMWAGEYKEDPSFVGDTLADRLENTGRAYKRSKELDSVSDIVAAYSAVYQIGLLAYSADNQLLYSTTWDDGKPIYYKDAEYADMDALLLALRDEAVDEPNGDAFFLSRYRDQISLDDLVIVDVTSAYDWDDAEYIAYYSRAPQVFYVVTVYHISPSAVVGELLDGLYKYSFELMVLMIFLALLNTYFNLARPLKAARRVLMNGWNSVHSGKKEPRGWKEAYDILEALEAAHEEEAGKP